MNLPFWVELIVSVLIVLSGVITLIGNIGLVKLQFFRKRIHAPTLGNSLGVWFLMIASIIVSWAIGDRLFFHEIIVVIFIFVSSPISWTLLMRSYILKVAKESERE